MVRLSQSAFSTLLTRLEKDGLGERCACTGGRRSVVITGGQRYEEARPTQRHVLRSLVP